MSLSRYQSCIEACDACADACDYCASACLGEDDVTMMVACVRLDLDCAAICRLVASYMSRDSAHATDLCRVCADVCDACGEECARHAQAHCKACAQACRRCADECRRMATAS